MTPDYRIRTSLERKTASGRTLKDTIADLLAHYRKHRVVMIWLDKCKDETMAKLHEREFLDQIDAMKRNDQVQSNIERMVR